MTSLLNLMPLPFGGACWAPTTWCVPHRVWVAEWVSALSGIPPAQLQRRPTLKHAWRSADGKRRDQPVTGEDHNAKTTLAVAYTQRAVCVVRRGTRVNLTSYRSMGWSLEPGPAGCCRAALALAKPSAHPLVSGCLSYPFGFLRRVDRFAARPARTTKRGALHCSYNAAGSVRLAATGRGSVAPQRRTLS